MVNAHGGRISVESAGPDKGATVTVILNTVPAPAESKFPGAKVPGEDKKLATHRAKQRKGRVLVVDDHQDTCIGMKMILERRGYQVTLAHSADQAVEKARDTKFDLLISDIGLPDRSGYELMEELRAQNGLPGIALSGFGMENDITRARAAGFSDHLTKPINLERLEQAIRNLLEPEPNYQS
jgi:CheY-like chemotaxis protein